MVDEFIYTENLVIKDITLLRKKAISNVINNGMEQKDYWMYVGRLAELRHLNMMSMDALKRYDFKKKKKDKKK